MDKWLLTAEASIPVLPPSEENAPANSRVASFSLSWGPDTIRFIPQQPQAKGTEGSSVGAEAEPRYGLEVIVEADQPPVALQKSLSLVDGTLDLVTFLVQRPCSLVSRQKIVNLTLDALAKEGQEVEQTIGVFGQTFRPDEPFPPHKLLTPPEDERVKAALRWHRKAMLADNWEDNFLARYIVLELLSPVIKPENVSTHICRECGKNTGIAKAAREGILFVLTDILHKKASLLDRLARTRARIVHGAKYGEELRDIVARDMGLMTEVVIAAMKYVLGLGQEGLPQPAPFEVEPNSVVLWIQHHGGDSSSGSSGG